MSTIRGKFVNDSGITELEGALETDQPLNADTIGGVAINNTPSGAGETLQTVDPSNAQWAAGGGGQTELGTYGTTGVTVETDTFVLMPWTFGSGDALLDLTTPTIPTFVDAGVYVVAVYVTQDENADADSMANFLLTAATQALKTSAILSDDVNVISAQLAATLPVTVAADDELRAQVLQESSGDVDFTFTGYVQRIA